MRALFVAVSDETLQQLQRLAEEERRRPRDQASWLLERAIQEAARRAPERAAVAAEVRQ